MKETRVLIIEDDNDINHLLKNIVEDKGYIAVQAFSGTEGLLHLKAGQFNLVLLDLMLPGLSGEELLTELRSNKTMPVIVLSAKTDKASKLKALNIGADDYITKPFDIEEVAARINAQLRRSTVFSGQSQDSVLSFYDIILNPGTREVSVSGKPLLLTAHEFSILALLMQNPKKVFTRSNIFECVWGCNYISDDSTVNVHISNIRQKLAALSPDKDYIKTVWGVGFKMGE